MPTSSLKDTDKGSWNRFIDVCASIEKVSARTTKTELVQQFIADYDGDLRIFLKLMLPKISQRTFQMNIKKIIKLFASIFNEDEQALQATNTSHAQYAGKLGDVICHHFKQPSSSSTLSMRDIDAVLDTLSQETRESPQQQILRDIVEQCTTRDLQWFVRCIDRDLKMNAGTKCVLDGVDEKAYIVYQSKSSLDYLVRKLSLNQSLTLTSDASDLMYPVKPMLATACKSYSEAFNKFKSKVIYAEIKYDGERVQVHFDGTEWKFYARSLKPVQPYKIASVQNDVSLAMPNAKRLILDSEVLMVDGESGKLLPFTSIGKHKRAEFGPHAKPCLFVFDILHLNGENLLTLPLTKRREILEAELKEIKNCIHLSVLHKIESEPDLQVLMEQMISENHEGLVLKDSGGAYAPGKRHWLKMKKDHLNEGQMADAVDLVVLAAYKGTGRHGGKKSTFLMGAREAHSGVFFTVCKVHNGLSDDQIDHYTDTLQMRPFDASDVPTWLQVSKSLHPDWIMMDVAHAPVFEVVGFEFSESNEHTATDHSGQRFSIRFPRIKRVRADKSCKTATNLSELRTLVKTSRDNPSSALDKQKNRKRSRDDKDEDEEQVEDEEEKEKPKGKNTIKAYFGAPPTKKRKCEKQEEMDMDDAEAEEDEENDNDAEMKTVAENDIDEEEKDGNDEEGDGNIGNGQTMVVQQQTTDSRQVCRYDATCYRKYLNHFKEYQHPKKVQAESEKVRENIQAQIQKILDRKLAIHNASEIARDKIISAAKTEMDALISNAKQAYETKCNEAKQRCVQNKQKADDDYNTNAAPIKQTEQVELSKIQEKYGPK